MAAGVNILSIDPGRTTGLAVLSPPANVLLHAEIKTRDALRAHLEAFRPSLQVVVIEDFIGAGPRNSHAVFVLKLIGYVHGLCDSLDVLCVEQPPQKRKAFLPQAAELLGPLALAHERDALAHALAWLGR